MSGAHVVRRHAARDPHWGNVRRGQAEPARQRVRRDVHLEQPARHVVLQPLPHVALIRAGPRGELARGRRTTLVQRPVQPEPFAQIDGVELERPSGVAEEALGEGLGRIGHGLDDATAAQREARERGRDEAAGAGRRHQGRERWRGVLSPHPTARAGDPAGRRRCLEGPNAVAVKNELLGEREVRESLTEIQGSGPFTGAELGETAATAGRPNKRQR